MKPARRAPDTRRWFPSGEGAFQVRSDWRQPQRNHSPFARKRAFPGVLFLAGLLLIPRAAFSDSSWIPLTPTGGPPAPRRFHSSVYDPASNRLIIFGGCLVSTCQNVTQSTNEVWVLTDANGIGTPTWIQLAPTGSPPVARFLHAAVYDSANNRMIVWSGDSTLVSLPDLTDVWVLTNANGLGGTPAWVPLSPTGGPPPGGTFPGRENTSAVYDAVTNRMIVFGGASCDPCGGHDDVWVLTNANGLGGAPAWLELAPSGGPPSARYANSATFDSAGNRLMISAGLETGGIASDSWVLENATGLARSTGLPATPVWRQLPDGPEARYFHAAAYDPLSNRMVVFGGLGNSGFWNDVWVLDHANGAGSGPITWSPVTPMGTPPDARVVFYHYQLYDPVSRRLIVFGGDLDTSEDALTDSWILTDAVGTLAGASLHVDAHGSGSASNLNGVLEPGESVVVEPAWSNIGAASLGLTGIASLFEGPPAGGTTYTIVDDAADYGTLAAGATGDCTQDCYELAVSGPRPASHWDATFAESLSTTLEKTWTLHIGESFADVATSSIFYPHIENIFHHNVTSGCSDTDFCPEEPTLRKQMAVFVLKAKEGAGYLPPPATGIFDDVPASDPFAPWIEELFHRGVVAGCTGPGAKAYCPNDPVLRQQMAVFLLLTLEGPGYAPPACAGLFADVACPSLFADWIEDLSLRAITAGCGDGIYCPGDSTTRAQMAPFLARTFGLVLYGP